MKGVGADAYSTEIAHILEKIGSVEDVLKAINESAVKDIRDSYSQVDDELGEFNRNPNSNGGVKWLILQMLSLPVTKRIQHQIMSFLKIKFKCPDTIFNKVIMEFNEEENDD